MSIEKISLIITRSSGRRDLVPATIQRKDGRILFLKSPFSLKDEIKAMKGARWHGYEEENPIKAWSAQIRRLLYRLLTIPSEQGDRVACQKSEIPSGMVFNVSDRANALFYEAKRACQRCQRGFHRLYARERKERKGMINNMPIYIKVTIPL